jgi:hypothetical protein
LAELRHIRNHLVGYEATYAFNRANQSYASAATCGLPCTVQPITVAANAHEVTGDWIASLRVGNLRPFALAGGGLLLSVPAGGQLSTRSVTQAVFVYGGGLDWEFVPHIGVRGQYRGNLSEAPDLSTVVHSTSKLGRTAEPMIGVYIRF